MTTAADQEFEFHEVVAKVEERFRAELDSEAKAKLGALPGSGGGEQGKYEPKMVSTGWWVVLARFGVAVRVGSDKPAIEPGDTFVMTWRRIPKKPDAPAVADQPPPIPPGIYFSAEMDNFYDVAANKGCGNDFFATWKPRWREFPAAVLARVEIEGATS